MKHFSGHAFLGCRHVSFFVLKVVNMSICVNLPFDSTEKRLQASVLLELAGVVTSMG